MGRRPLFPSIQNNIPVAQRDESDLKNYILSESGYDVNKMSDDLTVLSKMDPIDYGKKRIKVIDRISNVVAYATDNIVRALCGDRYISRVGYQNAIDDNGAAYTTNSTIPPDDRLMTVNPRGRNELKKNFGAALLEFVLDQLDPLTEQAKEEFLDKYPEK
jgi:hypothetical protein